ncbi:hypothetical protein [Streptomyces sp. NPDC047976]
MKGLIRTEAALATNAGTVSPTARPHSVPHQAPASLRTPRKW